MCEKSIKYFPFLITIVSILINFNNFFMGNTPTIYNLLTSIIFLLLWFLISFFNGYYKNIVYKKIIFFYWIINIITSIFMIFTIKNDYDAIYLIPFSILYNCPTYGFRYLISNNLYILILFTMPLGFIFSFSGYFLGIKKRGQN